jgi:predicted RNA-binding protein
MSYVFKYKNDTVPFLFTGTIDENGKKKIVSKKLNKEQEAKVIKIITKEYYRYMPALIELGKIDLKSICIDKEYSSYRLNNLSFQCEIEDYTKNKLLKMFKNLFKEE